ncbi:MAG: sensor domain-containing diguanylate cyclase [Sulfuricurvum sp.]|nr:sensor domain-containing diguanylate cyclase [Sulfuricurvum sp.]MDP3023891.1 sensor domain-containing diguanylate cyclase [Sulfuricurvum sp.]
MITLAISLTCIAMAGWIIYLIKRSSPDNNRYHALFQSSPSALIELDEKFTIVGWNQSAQLTFGWNESEAIGQHVIDFLVPLKDRGHVYSTLQKALKEGKSDSKNFNLTKGKKEIFCEWHNSQIDHNYPGILCTARDITEITSHVSTLTHQACHDPLTGVTNRAVMDDRLHHAIDRAQRAGSKIALYFIDLNDFKLINDQHGHEAGDKILIAIASSLRACLRNSDTISRFGGDEFIIIIEDIEGEQHTQSVLKTIEGAISEPIFLDDEVSLATNASIGMAIYPDDAADADSLIKAADIAMYIQKKQKTKKTRTKPATRKKTPMSLELPLYSDTPHP